MRRTTEVAPRAAPSGLQIMPSLPPPSLCSLAALVITAATAAAMVVFNVVLARPLATSRAGGGELLRVVPHERPT